MAKQETKKGMISRMIRSAFRKAEIGEDRVARQLWQEVINLGYVPNPHTEKGLEIAIENGLRETRLPKNE